MLTLNPVLFGKAISTCLVISSISLAHGTRVSQHEENKWQPWLEIGGFTGSDNASRGEAALFVPLYQTEDRMVFTELRGKLFTEGSREGNLALGYRQMLDSGWNLGGWVGFDARVSKSDNRFRQAAAGLEALSANWDLRLNGYYPLSDAKAYNAPVTAQVVGNQIYITGAAEVPLHGVDFEAGHRLSVSAGTGSEFWLYGGGFWFDDALAAEPVTGPKLRAEWRFNEIFAVLPGSSLVLETGYSYDEVRDDGWEFGLKLKIPLGSGKANRFKPRLSVQEQRMLAALERDTDIVSADSGRETVQDAATGAELNQVAFAADDAGLTQAIGQGSNTLIVLDGKVGTFNGGRTMAMNQTLLGGGGTVQLRGVKTGGSGTYTAAGTRPKITHTGNTSVFQVADGNHFIGLDVSGAGFMSGSIFNHGFSDRSVAQENAGAVLPRQALVFDNVNLTELGGSGIRLGGASDLSLQVNQVTVEGASGSGFDFTGAGGLVNADVINLDARFNNITMHDIGRVGIDFNSAVQGFKSAVAVVKLNGVNIKNTGDDGINMSSAFNRFVNGSADVEVVYNNVTIENTGILGGGTGINMSNFFDQFHGGNGRLMLAFDDVTVRQTPETAIAFNGSFDEFNNGVADLQITLNNILIEDAGFAGRGEGIYFGGGLDEAVGSTLNASLALTNINISRVADDGINLQVFDEFTDSTVNAQLSLDNVTVTDAGILNPNAEAIDMSGAFDETVNSTVHSTTVLRNIIVDGAPNGIDISHAYDEISNSRGNASLSLSNIQVRNVAPGYGIALRDSFNQFTGIQPGALSYQVELDNITVDGTFDSGVSFNGSGDNLAISRQLIMRNLNLSNTALPSLDLTNLNGFTVTQQ